MTYLFRLAFAQIYKLHGYGQYKMKGSIINVPSNINQMWLMLPCLPYDEATIIVFLKWQLEYKSPYMSRNVHAMYLYYQLHYKMHNNINTFKHVRKTSCCL